MVQAGAFWLLFLDRLAALQAALERSAPAHPHPCSWPSTPLTLMPAASSPFFWLRVQGFDRLVAAFDAGVASDHAALAASLDQTYSQVLEVVLSSLERQLVASPVEQRRRELEQRRRELEQQEQQQEQQQQQVSGSVAPDLASSTGTVRSGSQQHLQLLLQQQQHQSQQQQQQQSQQQQQLPPGGLAPSQAPPEEWAAAMRALQGAAVLHAKTRAVLASAQYLQLLVNRACSCPPAAPPALDALLAVAASSGEAQALLVGNGGLDAVARLARGRVAQQGVRGGGGGGGGGSGGDGGGSGFGPVAVPREVQLRCLGFIHVFVGYILTKSVRAGQVHPNTHRSSQQLLHSELGQTAAELLCRHSDETLAAGRSADGGGGAAEGGGASVGRQLDAVAAAALAAMVKSNRVSVSS
jgi:hypothetical protein